MTEPCEADLDIKVLGLQPELAEVVRGLITETVKLVSHKFDLVGLDGITFATDYQQALLDLDRGYSTDFKLTPSNDHGVGIAMSPCVIRGSKLRTHIVINALEFIAMIEDKRGDMAIHTVAHECAHVELNNLFDEIFPGILLHAKANVLDHFRTECMLACWNEFGACWRSATYGPTNKLDYEAAFLPALEETRHEANAAIMAYRTHSDVSIVVNEVCRLYHNLLKYSAYHLGNLHGHNVDWRTVPTTAEPLENHWFLPFFERLDVACKAIAEDLGNWKSSDLFDVLRDIAEDLVADGGMYFERHENDRISLDIPMSIETMSVPPHLWY